MNDRELRIALALLIPEKIKVVYDDPYVAFFWRGGPEDLRNNAQILDTEWLHVCLLLRIKYQMTKAVKWNSAWQEQASYLIETLISNSIKI